MTTSDLIFFHCNMLASHRGATGLASCCWSKTGPPGIRGLTSWSCPGRRRSRRDSAGSPAASGTPIWARPCPWYPCSWTSAWAPHPRPCPCPPWVAGVPWRGRDGAGILSQLTRRPRPAITTSSTTTTTTASAHGTSASREGGDEIWRRNDACVTSYVICCYL